MASTRTSRRFQLMDDLSEAPADARSRSGGALFFLHLPHYPMLNHCKLTHKLGWRNLWPAIN